MNERWRFLLSREGLKGDLFGGLTTAIVSLPLALAFGVASGAGAQAGLYGAVLVGLFAALFGGTRTLISEPTGPMTLMFTAVLTNLSAKYPDHALPLGFTTVMIAGLTQIAVGRLKLGRFITLMPYAVVSGFMSGIGILLILLQIPAFLGHPAPGGGAVGIVRQLPGLAVDIKWPEFALAVGAFAFLFLVPSSWRQWIPPNLIVLIMGTALSTLWLGGVDLRRLGTIPTGLPKFQLPIVDPDLLFVVVLDGMILGLLGCVDALLTAKIADSLTRTQHDSNRELIGQGIGNLVSGLFGGLPGAGATMGTVVNIQSGASTPRSGVFRALILLAIAAAAGPLLSNVPLAVLGAITAKAGVSILDWSFMRRAHRVSMTSTCLMYGVLLLTVFVDVIVAVGVGMFIANILTIDNLSKYQQSMIKTIDPSSHEGVALTDEERTLFELAHGRVVLFHMSGPMIFGVADAISRQHAAMKDASVLILDLSDVTILGTTAGLSIENVIRDALAGGAHVIVAGAKGKARDRLQRLQLLGEGSPVQDCPTRIDALKAALAILPRDVG
ncbi:MAG: SulP family inorganic anion transporter [Kiritimatiellae bacterium]|nr:SulP family inorganic anion transporter [Kiritimatiellia bacterium]MDW8458188.1 SulP family inorganic anion transporter [Verrucomicrobiota bacterium]